MEKKRFEDCCAAPRGGIFLLQAGEDFKQRPFDTRHELISDRL